MAGTVEGGKKAAAKNLANDPDFYRRIGRKGGSRSTPTGGFGADPDRARRAGAKGGRISRRYSTIGDSGAPVADKHQVTQISATA